MLRSDFYFDLPEELIAQQPLASRSASRLLYLQQPEVASVESYRIQDLQFLDLPNLLQPNDLLVFNNTKVIPARLYAHKLTGGKVEILLERLLNNNLALAQLRANKKIIPETELKLHNGQSIWVISKNELLFTIKFDLLPGQNIDDLLAEIAHTPLPPYIKRAANALDIQRYQTVYATQPGAVAAPTAGLHFDQAMLDKLNYMGIRSTFITLHVGAGTFSPVRVNDISQHQMHREWFNIPDETCAQIALTHQLGGRVIAIGTTCVRALETFATTNKISGETQIFITPGYEFKLVDGLLTNFHLPESTLLMLVCAFAGQDAVLQAYKHAVAQKYRFFSYGDAMLTFNHSKFT